jgi:spore cortex biosynthesis protein YabQ
VTLYTQWLTMGLMVGSGWLMGVILDTYRVLKSRFRLRGWVVSLVDLLYWLVATGLVFGLLMWSNWGELRFYIFVAIVIGFALYQVWFSRWVTRVVQWVVQIVEALLRVLMRIVYVTLWIPLTAIWTVVRKLWELLLALLRGIGRFLAWLASPLLRWMRPWMNRIWGRLRSLLLPYWNLWLRLRKWLRGKKEPPGDPPDSP